MMSCRRCSTGNRQAITRDRQRPSGTRQPLASNPHRRTTSRGPVSGKPQRATRSPLPHSLSQPDFTTYRGGISERTSAFRDRRGAEFSARARRGAEISRHASNERDSQTGPSHTCRGSTTATADSTTTCRGSPVACLANTTRRTSSPSSYPARTIRRGRSGTTIRRSSATCRGSTTIYRQHFTVIVTKTGQQARFQRAIYRLTSLHGLGAAGARR